MYLASVVCWMTVEMLRTQSSRSFPVPPKACYHWMAGWAEASRVEANCRGPNCACSFLFMFQWYLDDEGHGTVS